MTKLLIRTLLISLALVLAWFNPSNGQQLLKDLSKQIEIPNIKNINSSDTHLYVLSESEGLVVFRTQSDSLHWLYSSTGMQERGHILKVIYVLPISTATTEGSQLLNQLRFLEFILPQFCRHARLLQSGSGTGYFWHSENMDSEKLVSKHRKQWIPVSTVLLKMNKSEI